MMGHGIAVSLVSSAVGYWVLTQAESQKGKVRKLGQYLGVAIVLVSVLGAACKIYAGIQACRAMGMCPMLPR